MISQIHIKNFKSIVDLTLDLGRVNLFIGENGSGKSNILEAVAFVASTSNNEINNSILVSKGVRIAQSELFSSAFGSNIENIELNFTIGNNIIEALFKYDTTDKHWLDWASKKISDFFVQYGNYFEYSPLELIHIKNPPNFVMVNFFSDKITIHDNAPDEIKQLITKKIKSFESYYKNYNLLKSYIIYSPEVSSLRKFEEEGQVSPLGAHGEGLFSLIKSLSKDNGSLQQIKEHLEVIDWFEDFAIPNDLMSNEYKIAIKDRFINSDLKYLDQRSANEGFLFLLFYIVLFSSKKTPQFFAIDNIEASFNPKLCAKLITMLVELAKKNDKQVLMTTHNPATLDGLDLKDPEQRLFVVERNIDGHTTATRITEKPKVDAPMKLSEMWTKGFLGGLPENF